MSALCQTRTFNDNPRGEPKQDLGIWSVASAVAHGCGLFRQSFDLIIEPSELALPASIVR
jgi:hypothetical protein